MNNFSILKMSKILRNSLFTTVSLLTMLGLVMGSFAGTFFTRNAYANNGVFTSANPSSGTLTAGQNLVVDMTVTLDPTDTNPVTSPSCLINGTQVSNTFTNLTTGSNGHFRFTYTVDAGDTNRAAGQIPISCTLQQTGSVTVTAFDDNNTVGIGTNVASSAKDITAFGFPQGTGTISGTNISVTVPSGTNVTALVPTITVSSGASINPTSGTAQNFTNPVTYTVTAANNSTQAYTVTVNVASGNTGGNTGPGNNAVIVGNGASINFPTSAIPSSGTLTVGQTLEVNFTDSSATSSTSASSTSCLVNGVNVASSFERVSTTVWKVTYTVGANDASRTAGNIPIDCTLIGDQASLQVTRFNDSNTVAINASGNSSATAPSLSGVSINPSSGKIEAGDVVTVTFTENTGQTNLSVTGSCKINAVNVASSFQNMNNGTYTLSYTVGSNDGERPAGHIPVACTLGNSAGNVTAGAWNDNNTLSIDTNNDGVIDNGTNNLGFTISASPSSGTLNAGAQIIVSMQDPLPSGDVTIVPAGQTSTGSATVSNGCKVNGVDVSSSYAYHGNGLYKVTYTVGAGNTNRAAGAIPFDCTLSNHTGTVNLVAFTDGNTVAVNTDTTPTPDTTRPTITSTNPASGATSVAIGSNIDVIFSEEMDMNTLSTSSFVLTNANGVVAGTVSYSGNVATYNPTNDLSAGTTYTVHVRKDLAKDTSGNAVASSESSHTWLFTTASNTNTSPTLSSIAITTPATKLDYTVGQTLDISGLVVTGTYSDGSTQAQSISASNVTGFNSSSAADNQVLTITVNGRTTTYMVDIAAAGTQSSAKAITSFTLGSSTGNINENNHTISVNVPFGTSVTSMTPTFVTTGSAIAVGTTAQVSGTTSNNFTSPVTYRVTAENGSTQDYVATVNVLPQGTSSSTVNNTNPQVTITSSTQPVVITVASGTTSPTMNLDVLITAGTGTLPEITITYANANNATVTVPASTIVTSTDTSWNGIFTLPTTTTSVTLPTISGQTLTLATAIELGGAAKLSFNKAVRILLSGQAGKRVGYIRPGINFTEITSTCSADTQVSGNTIAVDGDCKMDVGADLAIWTKHFTTFATYTQVASNTGGGSGGGGGSSGGGSGGAVNFSFINQAIQRAILGCDIRTSGFSTRTGESCSNNIANALTAALNLAYFNSSNSQGQVLGASTFKFTKKLKVRMSGIDITELQNKLMSLGLYSDKVDGKFGSKTKKAVAKFQKANKLKADGVVGSKTMVLLNR